MYQFLICVSSLFFSINCVAQFGTGNMKNQPTSIEKFEYHKGQVVKIFGCSTKNDADCINIKRASDIESLSLAVESKRISEQKKLLDRVNLLECCLGVDTKQTCEGIDKNDKDLNDCKKSISK